GDSARNQGLSPLSLRDSHQGDTMPTLHFGVEIARGSGSGKSQGHGTSYLIPKLLFKKGGYDETPLCGRYRDNDRSLSLRDRVIGRAFHRESSQADEKRRFICSANVGGGAKNLVEAGGRLSRDPDFSIAPGRAKESRLQNRNGRSRHSDCICRARGDERRSGD